MKKFLQSRMFIVGVLSILIALAVLVSAVPAAYAEGNGPLTQIPGLGRPSNDTLMRMHNKEIGWLKDQESMFFVANRLLKTFQAVIDAESKAGKDVTILVEAYAVFNSELEASRQINTQAGVTILNLTGWKASGDVRDRLAAGQSILDGRVQLKDASFRLTQAIADLRKGFSKWRATRIHNNVRPTGTPVDTNSP